MPTEPLAKGTSASDDLLKHQYIMFYRHGMNANLIKGFYFNGPILEAKKRAIEHCKIMNYHFIFVRPMICDLTAEEQYKISGQVGEVVA